MASLALSFAPASHLPAQSSERTVDGVVMHGETKGPRPIGGVRVVLHRVGPDRAGPLDSMLTDPRGRYHFRYVPSGSPDAVYFVSASYDGIAYFTAPLPGPVARGDDAQIQVFDTTSGPVPIRVLGHHIIVGSPDAHGQREAVEVFELGNDSSVTRVSGGLQRPVWQGALPRGVTGAKVNPTGEIAPSATSFDNGVVRLYAPISPGARQLSYAYQVPKAALPLSFPIEQPTSVLEVLLEEPHATVVGGNVAEVAPTTSGGRSFRRFLGQNIPIPNVVQVDVPFTIGDARTRFFVAIAAICGATMVGAILFATRRRRALSPVPAAPLHSPAADELLQSIAQLDAQFEQDNHATPDQRAEYDAARARLKSRLAAALAEERGPR